MVMITTAIAIMTISAIRTAHDIYLSIVNRTF